MLFYLSLQMWMTEFVRKFVFSNAKCLSAVITILMIWSVILRVIDLIREQTGGKVRHSVGLLLKCELCHFTLHPDLV